MTVSYLPIGQDASVSYGSVDFKFTNSRTYPIKIVATAKAGVITVSVLGVLEKQEYVVTFETEILETTDYKTTYEYSSSVPVGKEEIKQVGKMVINVQLIKFYLWEKKKYLVLYFQQIPINLKKKLY